MRAHSPTAYDSAVCSAARIGQHVIHVGAMVHDEHHRGLRVDLRQPLVVGEADPHPVQEPCQALGQPVADAEVRIGVERRHDLPGVLQHLGLGHRARHLVLDGVDLHRFDHFRVEGEPVDQHLALGELKRAYGDVEVGVDLVDNAVDAPPQPPAHAWHQHAFERGPGGERHDQQKQPQWQTDGAGHSPLPVFLIYAVGQRDATGCGHFSRTINRDGGIKNYAVCMLLKI